MMVKAKRKTVVSPEDMALHFLDNLMRFHQDDLGTKARDAVIRKSVALVALAFEFVPTAEENAVNIDETAAGLVDALIELRSLRQRA